MIGPLVRTRIYYERCHPDRVWVSPPLPLHLSSIRSLRFPCESGGAGTGTILGPNEASASFVPNWQDDDDAMPPPMCMNGVARPAGLPQRVQQGYLTTHCRGICSTTFRHTCGTSTREGPIRQFQMLYLCSLLVQVMLLYLILKLCMSPFIWGIVYLYALSGCRVTDQNVKDCW